MLVEVVSALVDYIFSSQREKELLSTWKKIHRIDVVGFYEKGCALPF